MKILKAGINDVSNIHHLAGQVWEPTYKDILSQEQLVYMFNQMYSHEAITSQITHQGHKYIIAKDENGYCGFTSYQLDYKPATVKIHKIYVLPGMQGRGVGKLMLDAVENDACKNRNNVLTLNVNRFNKAIHFYTRTGFANIGSEDIHIGNGYLMEDYIMQKSICTL